MKVLITGGAGFIGSHLVEHFQGQASEIRVLDNLRTGSRKNLEGLGHHFIEGSVTDPGAVREAIEGVDLVFHLAALVSVPESVEKPLETIEINSKGTINILAAASGSTCRKVVFASSAAVYGDNPTIPKREEMLPEPKSPYAVTKLDGEYYMQMYHCPGKLETCSIRFFNVFGPRQDPNGGYAAAVPIFLKRAINHQPITIFGDGGQTRDFIYVKDIVSALAFASSRPVSGVFNAGYGQRISITEIATIILRAVGSSSAIQYSDMRPGDVRHSAASVERLTQAGWEPNYSLAEGLRLTTSYEVQQESPLSA
jgi:UDP-glucose 4-epimerase